MRHSTPSTSVGIRATAHVASRHMCLTTCSMKTPLEQNEHARFKLLGETGVVKYLALVFQRLHLAAYLKRRTRACAGCVCSSSPAVGVGAEQGSGDFDVILAAARDCGCDAVQQCVACQEESACVEIGGRGREAQRKPVCLEARSRDADTREASDVPGYVTIGTPALCVRANL